MRREGFTLVELLIVIVIIALLASLLIPAIVAAICAAKETRCANLIVEVESASKLYERDYNVFPPMSGSGFNTGPVVNTLSQPGPKKQAYMDFVEDDVMVWPISPNSHLRNPVDTTQSIKYVDNTLNPSAGASPTGVHNKYAVDMWAEDCKGTATGINNWRGTQ